METSKKSILISLAAILFSAVSLFTFSHGIAQGAEATLGSTPSKAETSSDNAPSSASSEYSPEAREYYLKAAFLRYVAKFVEWPANTMPEGIINLCVLGQVPSFEAISSINGKVVNDRAITISKVSDLKEISVKNRCQILYVTKTEEAHLKSIIKEFQNAPILTFGDMTGFAEEGGDMNFYIMNNRLAIMANLPTVEKSNLKLNPRMMRLVTVVPPIPEEKTAQN